MARPLVIAIDGPAGAGKSTVTRLLAERLGILKLDTGAMYRTATLAVLAAAIDRDDPHAVGDLVARLHIDFDDAGRVRMEGAVQDSDLLRSPATTREVWRVADNPACRAHLVGLQKAIVRGRDAVVEGRDATTVICPDAQLKVFLDATPEERARRRLAEWTEHRHAGDAPLPTLADIAADIRERDRKDTERAIGALTLTDEAVHLVCDGMSVDEVVAQITAYAVQRHPFLLEARVADQAIVGRSREPGYVRVATGDAGSGWQLGLTNPSPGRMPGATTSLARNHGGRQAGTVVQGNAILVLGGRDGLPGRIDALPMLPQTWYTIEPGCWHAVIQAHGTICAWAEAQGIREESAPLDDAQQRILRAFLTVYLPG